MLLQYFLRNFRRRILGTMMVIALAITPAVAQTPLKVYTVTTVNIGSGNKAADFTWTEDGKTVSLSEVGKNKVVFLNFWATWCAPCRKEIPDIIELMAEFPETEFVVIGISVDRDADVAKTVSKFMRAKKIPYRVLISNDKLLEAYGGISDLPTTFILNSDGTIAVKILGGKTKEEFKAAIKKAR
ncbi:MAG: TlpA disulfide reductase family protein [Candidatus Kapaibacterium sp.]